MPIVFESLYVCILFEYFEYFTFPLKKHHMRTTSKHKIYNPLFLLKTILCMRLAKQHTDKVDQVQVHKWPTGLQSYCAPH